MPSISVSNLDCYRQWRDAEEYDLDCLLRKLRGEEPQSEAMKAGEALHTALETADLGEALSLEANGYRFYVQTDGVIELPIIRESKIEKRYGELLVRGRVDGITGTRITDYKSTSHFDADRLLEGFQWRFYLDMTNCDSFLWKIFTLREFGGDVPTTTREANSEDPWSAEVIHAYEIVKVEELSQHRYEGLAQDCERLAAEFLAFTKGLEQSGIAWARTANPTVEQAR